MGGRRKKRPRFRATDSFVKRKNKNNKMMKDREEGAGEGGRVGGRDGRKGRESSGNFR